MILPIKKEPSITSYMHHTFISSILESKEILRLNIKTNKKSDWTYCQNNIEINQYNDVYSIISKEADTNNSGIIYKNCTEEDDIVIHILYQRKLNAISYIQFVIFDTFVSGKLEESEKLCTFALDNYGFYYNNKQYEYCIHEYKYIRYSKDNQVILFSTSKDGKTWEIIYKYLLETDVKCSNLKVAIDFNLGVYTVELWKNMNFIQLFYTEANMEGRVLIDYFMFPKKNTDYAFVYELNYLKSIEYNYDEMVRLHGSLTKFLLWCITNGFYIVLKLDEYYISQRKAYNQYHYLHDNMIYGYKEVAACFCTLGFNNIVTSCDADYEIIENACDTNNVIRVYKFDCNNTILSLNVNYIKKSLKEYLYGIDSSTNYANIATNPSGIYGLKIYKYLFEKSKGKESLLTDIRISYVIYEHNLLLKEKIILWTKYGYIDKKTAIEITISCEEIVSISKTLVFGVLRNKKNKNTEKVIFETIKKLFDLESVLYKKILGCLHDK